MEPNRLQPVHTADRRRAFVTELTTDGGRMREMVLLKGGQRHTFRCALGTEAGLIAELRQRAADPDQPIDLFDVAMISHELGRRLAQTLSDNGHRPSPRRPVHPPAVKENVPAPNRGTPIAPETRDE